MLTKKCRKVEFDHCRHRQTIKSKYLFFGEINMSSKIIIYSWLQLPSFFINFQGFPGIIKELLAFIFQGFINFTHRVTFNSCHILDSSESHLNHCLALEIHLLGSSLPTFWSCGITLNIWLKNESVREPVKKKGGKFHTRGMGGSGPGHFPHFFPKNK